MQVAIVGVGNIGAGIARRAVSTGHMVTAFDVSPQALDAAAAFGAVAADSARAAAEAASVVLTCLPGPAQVEEAVTADDGVLPGLRAGAVLIDCSTVDPALSRRLSARVESAGAEMLDAPVSRGRVDHNTEDGGLTFMVGGRPEVFERCRPLLADLGRVVVHVGPAGSGSTAKLVTQYIGWITFVATAEALTIAAKAGLDIDAVCRVIPESAAASRTFPAFVDSVLPRRFGPNAGGRAPLSIVAKDVKLACQLARELGVPAQLGLVAEDAFRRAEAAGLGPQAYAAVATVIEAAAGVTLATAGETAGTEPAGS
jgi:3-hydroxyisobutyrate dehydrogenase-like beta-hydroxyacid dehydrogenase